MQKLFTFRMAQLSRASALCLGMALAGAALADAPPPVTEPAPPPAVNANLPHVSIKTTMGEIVLELDQEKAPKTVANFLLYVKSGFYNKTIFHRVIDGFMIQGGGMDAKLVSKPTRKPIKNESDNGLHNGPYTISMARQAHPDTATSQWFINVADNTGLDYPNMQGSGYAVFGKVIKGQEVVDKIKSVVVDDVKGMQNVPVVPVFVNSVTILKQK